MKITEKEILELKEVFNHLINYESDDPCDPIDPLTYTAPDGDNCLHTTSRQGNLRAVQLLIKAGLDVNRTGDMGETPLHVAARKKNRLVIKALLKAGAKTDIISEFGKSPQKEAEVNGFSLVVTK